MITYLIKQNNIINKILFNNDEFNNKRGSLVRVSNQDIKQYYFIESDDYYKNLLFFNKNKIKTRLKELLIRLNLQVIPDTSKNRNIELSKELIKLPLLELNDYEGLI